MSHWTKLVSRRLWTLVAVGSVLAISWIAQAGDEIAARRILDDVKHLSSDEMEGRGVGTKGLDRAADYIRDQFQKAGLKPAMPDGTFFQHFETPNGGELGSPNRLTIQGPSNRGKDLVFRNHFLPLAISGAGQFNAPLAFAGYGITAPKAGYDDYAGIDAKGCVVLVMGRGPKQGADPHAADPHAAIGGRQLDVRQKVTNAISNGALAVLYVTTPKSADEPDKLMEFGEMVDLRTAKIPVVQITQALADELIEPALGKTLAELRAAIDSDMKPRSSLLKGWTCSGEINVTQKVATVKNVLGMLEGTGPWADETIVIGAHYDHLGFGEAGSMVPGVREIHNGANDNASGTSGLMELARRLARHPKLPRRILFAAFTAEERGLIGSDYYVKNPAVPIEKTTTMINMDMIGRLRNEKLIVEGVGTAREFRPLIESLGKQLGFELKPVASGLGPSDQTPFCMKKIPVLFFWTDYHPEYHRPNDDWETISAEGIDRIVALVEETVVAIAEADSRPEFIEVPMPAPAAGGGGERAYLGTIPAFGEEVDGVLLSGVTPGAPAEKAGIRGGDVIIRIGDMDVHNLHDMQAALENHRPGDRLRITVRRGTLRIGYPVTLGSRQ